MLMVYSGGPKSSMNRSLIFAEVSAWTTWFVVVAVTMSEPPASA